MSEEKTIAKKLRILQRKDGAIFGWTPILDRRNDMHAGWQTIYEDGTQTVQLDKASLRDLDTSKVSEREKALIEENAKLRNQLAEVQGFAPRDPEKPIWAKIPEEEGVLLTGTEAQEQEMQFAPEDDAETPIPIEPETTTPRLRLRTKDK